MADFSTIKIGNNSFDVKDDTARNNISSLSTRLTTLENNTPNIENMESIETRLNNHTNEILTIGQRVNERTKTYFDSNNVFSSSSSTYSYEYTTFKVADSGARYLMLWGRTSAKGNQTITLPFSMYNANYVVVVSDERTSSNTTYSAVESVTTTSFKVVANNSNYTRFIVIGRLT